MTDATALDSNDAALSNARSTLTAGIAALVLESLLFGAFTVGYGICAWVLLFRSRSQGNSIRNIVSFAASTVMFVLTLVHVALDVHVARETFIPNAENVELEAMSHTLDVFNALSNSFGAAKFAIYVTQMLIGDGFMIYRAYVVWDRATRVIVVPVALLVGEVVIGYFISFSGPLSPIASEMLSCDSALVQAFFVLSAVTNMLSTGLIIRRILWATTAGIQQLFPQGSQLRSVKWRVFESILQSAAIYSIASITLAVTSFVSPTIAFPASHSVFPSIIGIVFLLIVMRISLSVGSGPELPSHPMLQVQVNGSSCMCQNPPPAPHDRFAQQEHSPVSPRPIAIQVSVSTLSDCESLVSFGRESPSACKILEDLEKTPV